MATASLARDGQQYLGSADVARLLGITVSAASKRISRGAFGPAVRNGATWHVSLAQFQAAMGGGTAPAPAPATPRRAAPRRRPLALRIRGAGRRAGHDHTATAAGL